VIFAADFFQFSGAGTHWDAVIDAGIFIGRIVCASMGRNAMGMSTGMSTKIHQGISNDDGHILQTMYGSRWHLPQKFHTLKTH